MSGPLAQQIAQVRDFIGEPTCWIRALDEGEDPNAPNPAQVEAENALAALSAIERHVQDMETALREIAESGVPGRQFRSPLAFVIHLQGVARAALPAREKGTE